MATLKLLALTFTILYLSALSTARISVPLNVQPKNDPKRTVFHHPTSDDDQVLSVEQLEPQVFEQHKKQETKLNNNDLNDEHKASDAISIELEMERPTNHMTQFKKKDIPIHEIYGHHDSDKDIAAGVVSENTISIETLHLNPSNYFRIRPINRHFHVKPSLFRIHRCRHHQNNHQEILTRDDMILAAGQTKERFDPSTLHITTHSEPEKRPMIHHHHDEDKNMMMMRRPFRQYIARQKLKKKVEEEILKRKEMDARKQGNGFMKSFRKFLNHF